MIDITDSNFENEVLKSDKLVFVDCYAEWCGPCKALKPLLIELEEKHPKMKLGMLNIDHNPGVVERLKVTSIPKVAIFKNGEEIAHFLGIRSKADFEDVIASF